MAILRKIRVRDFDLVLLCTALIISVFGVLTIFSAVHSGSSDNDRLWVAQAIRLAMALMAMSIALFIDYRILHSFSYIFYVIGFVVLSSLLFFPSQSGVRRWFMGGAIQPSELAKIILVIALARYLSDNKRGAEQFKVFTIAIIMVLVYTALIFLNPLA